MYSLVPPGVFVLVHAFGVHGERRGSPQIVGAGPGHDVRGDTETERRRGIQAARGDLHIGNRAGRQVRVPGPGILRGAHVAAIDRRHVRIEAGAMNVERAGRVLRAVTDDRAGREPEELGPVPAGRQRDRLCHLPAHVDGLPRVGRSRATETRPRRSCVSSSAPTFMSMSTVRFSPARMIRSSRTAFEKPESVAVSA